MSEEEISNIKSSLHPRNKNVDSYDLEALLLIEPSLRNHLKVNKFGTTSIDFKNPSAVLLLNKALLAHYYGISNWDFPKDNLCPPIPGRADYLHYIADLLAESNGNSIPKGEQIKALDIGTGATCIYPILGAAEYDWNFLATDICEKSVENAKKICAQNEFLKNKIEIRLQNDSSKFFSAVVSDDEKIDFTMCNPPFHASKEDAEKGTIRKIKNLSKNKSKLLTLNFSGAENELIYTGGEAAFIESMIKDSLNFKSSVFWFTTLVSKESNLKKIEYLLNEIPISERKTIELQTGNKKSRIVCWTFLTKEQQADWVKKRWN